MPFKDIATCDSVYMDQLPHKDDKVARTTLRRMQEASKSEADTCLLLLGLYTLIVYSTLPLKDAFVVHDPIISLAAALSRHHRYYRGYRLELNRCGLKDKTLLELNRAPL